MATVQQVLRIRLSVYPQSGLHACVLYPAFYTGAGHVLRSSSPLPQDSPPPCCGIAGVCISLAPDYWYFLLKSPLKHPLSFNKLPKFIQINLDQRQARSCHDPGWSPAWIVLCLQSFVSLWACFMVTAGGVFSELRL